MYFSNVVERTSSLLSELFLGKSWGPRESKTSQLSVEGVVWKNESATKRISLLFKYQYTKANFHLREKTVFLIKERVNLLLPEYHVTVAI